MAVIIHSSVVFLCGEHGMWNSSDKIFSQLASSHTSKHEAAVDLQSSWLPCVRLHQHAPASELQFVAISALTAAGCLEAIGRAEIVDTGRRFRRLSSPTAASRPSTSDSCLAFQTRSVSR